MVAARNGCLVRDLELSLLARTLSPSHPHPPHSSTQPSPRSHALIGFAGIGKTELARCYAEQYRACYQQILWVDAAGSDLTPGMAALAPLLGLSGCSPADAAAQVRDRLERGGTYLLILDNVTDGAAVPPHLPRFGATTVLLTSRRRDLHFATRQEVDALSESAALELLGGDQLSSGEHHAACRLVTLLSGHPLTLQAIAEASRCTATSLQQIYAAISTQGLRRWLSPQSLPPQGARYRLRQLLTDAFLDTRHPLARPLAHTSLRFPRQDLTRDALFQIAATDLAMSRRDCAHALEDLVDSGLLKVSDSGRVRVHQLFSELVA